MTSQAVKYFILYSYVKNYAVKILQKNIFSKLLVVDKNIRTNNIIIKVNKTKP